MDDLISRAAAIVEIYEYLQGGLDSCIREHDLKLAGYRNGLLVAIRELQQEIPAADVIPVGWLIDRANDPERAPLYRRYAQMLYEEWQKEQEG